MRNSGQNPSGWKDLRLCSNFEVEIRVKNCLYLSREKYQNGSYSESVPYLPFKTWAEKRQRHSLSKSEISKDFNRSFSQKLNLRYCTTQSLAALVVGEILTTPANRCPFGRLSYCQDRSKLPNTDHFKIQLGKAHTFTKNKIPLSHLSLHWNVHS